MRDWRGYFQDRSVWVTGASSGIGAAIVEELGAAGVRTLASARRVERLESLAERYESVSYLPLDLEDLEALGEAAARAWDLLGGVDVLVNNAGVSQRSCFVEAEPASLERVIAINLIGTMRLTHAVASRMASQGSGHLVTVTSMAAKVPPPRRTAYAASKQALHGLFDALRGELEPRGITITLAVPGYVKTEISTHALEETGAAHGEMDANQNEGHSSVSCARQILRGTASRRREFYAAMAPRLYLALALRRLAPGLLWRLLPGRART